jgi:glycosyltransferase involved in cell wall biosynthesis
MTAQAALAERPRRSAPTTAPHVLLVGCLQHLASAQRTGFIARALREAGAEVSTVSLEPELPRPGGSRSLSTRLGRRVTAARDGIEAIERAAREGVDVIFNYSESWLYSAPIWRIARRYGIRLIQDCVEWYEPICFGGNQLHPLFLDHRAKRARLAARADGVTVITSRLRDLYVKRAASTYLLPALCDGSEFEGVERRRLESFGIFEIVIVASSKLADGNELIRPILEAAYRRGARFNVTIIGSSDPLGGTPLRTTGHVEISRLSNLDRRDYVRALGSAEVFLLPRRRGLYSEAAFPNRVPEFLGSGGLLVTSNVGDLPRYIRHGETGLLCPEGDVDAFASALCWIADHRNEAADIGANGRRAAFRQFDYRTHADALLAFVLGGS